MIFLFITIGVFIARGKEDALVTKNIVPGETVYGEKKISVDVPVRYAFFFLYSFLHSVMNISINNFLKYEKTGQCRQKVVGFIDKILGESS